MAIIPRSDITIRLTAAALFWATIALPQAFAAAAPPPTCADCNKELAQLAPLTASLKSHQDLLERNRAYLASVKGEDLSKAVKVRSNILILTVRIETAKNNLEGAQLILGTKECKACPRPKL